MRNVSILGATGSIGTQTIDVLKAHKEDYKLLGVSANNSSEKIIEIINEFSPKVVAMTGEKGYEEVKNYCLENNLNDIEVIYGMEGLIKVATIDEVSIVVTSIVGMIGLKPTLMAIEKGKDIALANKETLVVGGEIVKEAVKKHNVKILPVDSEHSAIFQALAGNDKKTIEKVILTASGGPFRGKDLEFLNKVTLEQALKHPNWAMGRKITIDSATLMNKGLEVIEAYHLFDVDYDDIEVVIHPESIIHSMVEYTDGSIIAQLGAPDMRLPIQYALNYAERKDRVANKLDIRKLSSLNFYEPDMETFKCLKLAFEAGRQGGLMPTILNGANEALVDLFLKEKISFLDIPKHIEIALEKFKTNEKVTLDNIINLDAKVKEYIYNTLG